MNNKLINYTRFVEKNLNDCGIEFITEYRDSMDIYSGYCVFIRTPDVTGIMSDCTGDGSMYYAISFEKIDDFLKEYVSNDMLDKVDSYVILGSLRDFINIISDENKISMLVRIIKSRLREDLNL